MLVLHNVSWIYPYSINQIRIFALKDVQTIKTDIDLNLTHHRCPLRQYQGSMCAETSHLNCYLHIRCAALKNVLVLP